jgi:hypothetical protein
MNEKIKGGMRFHRVEHLRGEDFERQAGESAK